MILPDGTIYARNLTPDLARILAALNPKDDAMALRANLANPTRGNDSPTPDEAQRSWDGVGVRAAAYPP